MIESKWVWSRVAATCCVLALGLAVAAGCEADDDPAAGGGEAGAGDAPQGPGPGPIPPGDCEAPATGLGTAIGARFDSSVELLDCDGNAVPLVDAMCGFKLTLIDIGAGWCQPCIESAQKLESKLVEPFHDRGLQVISVLFEDENGNPATPAFCRTWRDQFKLTTPVLVDPTFRLKPYFDAFQQAAPVNMLIAEDGTIVYVETGVPATDLDVRVAAELNK